MLIRSVTVFLITIFLGRAYAQETPAPNAATEPPVEELSAPSGPVDGTMHVEFGAQGVNHVHHDGHHVYDHPVYERGCSWCPTLAGVVQFLWYRAQPVPQYCRCCKRYVPNCMPAPSEFFVHRYGYYNHCR